MRKIVINGESTSYIPAALGRGSWTQFLVNSPKLANDTIVNLATGGQTIQAIRGAYQTEGRERTHAPGSSGKAIYFLFGGINDIIAGRTAAQLYADYKTLWEAARADGYMIVAFTQTPCTLYTVGNGWVTVLADVNTLIRSEPERYDFLIEVDTVLTDATDLTRFKDGIHPTPKAAREIFDLVAAGPLSVL